LRRLHTSLAPRRRPLYIDPRLQDPRLAPNSCCIGLRPRVSGLGHFTFSRGILAKFANYYQNSGLRTSTPLVCRLLQHRECLACFVWLARFAGKGMRYAATVCEGLGLRVVRNTTDGSCGSWEGWWDGRMCRREALVDVIYHFLEFRFHE
jgi:hypothetical protein